MNNQVPSTTVPERLSPEPEGELALRSAILDALGEVVVAADAEGRVIYWNALAEEAFGWSAGEVMGSLLVTLVPTEVSRPAVVGVIRQLRAGRPWSGEIFLRDRSGSAFPMLVTATPIRDKGGLVVGMVALGRDMSAQHRAERALRESEQRLEMVHRATVSVIWEWDVRSHRMRWNDALTDSFGYRPEEVEETLTWWEERLHPEDRDRVTGGLWKTLSEGRRFWTDEYRFRTGNGTYAAIFGRAYVATDPNGRAERVVGTMLDLTERRRSHEAASLLLQAGMLLDLSLDYENALPGIARLATSSMADTCLLMVGGLEGTEIVASHSTCPRRRVVLEQMGADLQTDMPGHGLLAQVLRTGESMLLSNIPPELFDREGLPPDVQQALEVLDVASLVMAPVVARSQVVGVVALGQAPESPRLTEDDLRIAEELGRRIGVAVDNARLFQTAELAKRAKSDFLSMISHELRTPLTAVQGYADLLDGEISGTLNDTQKRQVARIRSGADRLLRVIEGILVYTRLETGKEPLQLERRPLQSILEYVGDMIRPQAADGGIRYVEEHDAVPAIVTVDVVKLNQVLLALLTNAVKFSSGGQVTLKTAISGRDLLFYVSDSGPGISEEHLPHIFNPFWQAEQPEIRRASGAGLGLSVGRRLARVMGGDLTVASTSPDGTTFCLQVPDALDG
ncbi:MAG TPA: PAS domain S-box protein [Longimicrobiales bacterium]|nr:PAS domain S-box protein [Longimicrobiales bacterium]